MRGTMGTSPRAWIVSVMSAVADAFMLGGALLSTVMVHEVEAKNKATTPSATRLPTCGR